MNSSFPIHPFCATSNDMSPADFETLTLDIKTNGQKIPILLCRGQVIDGRHRLRACNDLQIKPITDELPDDWTDDQLRTFVHSANNCRRHETTAQRILATEQLLAKSVSDQNARSPIKSGKSDTAPGAGLPKHTLPEIAKASKASLRAVEQVHEVQTKAVPAIKSAMAAGIISGKTASAISKLPRATQNDLASKDPNDIRKAMADLKSSRTLGTSAYVTNHSTQPILTSDIPRASIEALYAANKAAWNSPPPPTARQIIDAILSLQ